MQHLRTSLKFALVASIVATFAGSSVAGSAATVLQTAALNVPDQILYAFAQQGKGDGAGPLTGVVVDGTGAMFGTTAFGGTYGAGTVFKLSPNRGGGATERVLYNFGRGNDGATPGGGIAIDSSHALYTVTIVGGASSAGTVVKLTPGGSGYREQVIYNFSGGSDGNQPIGTPIVDGAGNVFGITQLGGSFGSECARYGGCGAVVKLAPSKGAYTESTIYQLPGGAGGIQPQAGLTLDAAGALYGTTYAGGDLSCGGAGCGVVFKLAPSGNTYTESVLHAFHGNPDGATPFSLLTVDANSGALYGTTEYGGNGCNGTCGTVYQLAPAGSGYDERVIYSFTGSAGGELPQAAVLLGSSGAIYGTANFGGKGCSGTGCGLVFKLSRNGAHYAFSVVHYFESGKDGAEPQWSPLIRDASGALYGTTRSGGGPNCSDGGPGGTKGCGVVFRLVP